MVTFNNLSKGKIMFKVLVIVAGSVIDSEVFAKESQAVNYASEQQDMGRKVRIVEVATADDVLDTDAA
jgi:hypothetical protein